MIDPRYITANDLCPYFVDKSTGQPLAGGVVSFWQDDSRTTPKLVYQLTGSPPNYTYTPLPNPLTLSNTGTFQDASGNNIAVYYFPYDSNASDANIQLYYITVTNSEGLPQFTREAWPNATINESQVLAQADISNALTNPQFAEVLFNPANILTISLTGTGTSNINIAPGWTLNVTTTGATTVGVTRNSIAGSTAYPYNPPYTLTVTPGANITALSLSQRLYHNPSIWSPQSGGTNGYLASSILLAPLSAVTIKYAPSTGAAQSILTATNSLGTYQEFNNTVQLATASNTDSADVGYVDIEVVLPVGAATTFSNVQVAGLESNLQITYDQTPVNRQKDYMFHYYNPLLQYKPIPSYLCGWDFPLNPVQPLGPSIPNQSIGANKSYYAWDQTIIFQSANSGIYTTRGGNGELVLTATVSSVQPAIIQYLDATKAREMLNSRMSCAIEGKTSRSLGVTTTISLWYCTDASLPNIASGTNNSLIATLDSNGHPSSFNGNWVEVPRSNLGNAQFTISTNTNTNFNFYGFNGWDMQGIAATQTANFFAIVVGFSAITAADTISINSVSVVPGDIPTRPAPQSANAVLNDCQYYYQKSLNNGVIPVVGTGLGNGENYFFDVNNNLQGFVYFKSIMHKVPTITILNPVNNNNQAYNITLSSDVSGTTTYSNSIGQNGFGITWSGGASTYQIVAANWTADARLGIV